MAESRTIPNAARGRSLRREIIWVLAFKMVALTILYFAFFGTTHRIHPTPAQVAAVLSIWGKPGEKH